MIQPNAPRSASSECGGKLSDFWVETKTSFLEESGGKFLAMRFRIEKPLFLGRAVVRVNQQRPGCGPAPGEAAIIIPHRLRSGFPASQADDVPFIFSLRNGSSSLWSRLEINRREIFGEVVAALRTVHLSVLFALLVLSEKNMAAKSALEKASVTHNQNHGWRTFRFN